MTLEGFKRKMESNKKYVDVLRIIKKKGPIIAKDIATNLGMNIYVRDKAMAALDFADLIKIEADGSAKMCTITEDGNKLLEMMGE